MSPPAALVGVDGLQQVECLDDPCVYFLVRGPSVVYVGQTVNLRGRLLSHADKVFDAVFFVRCEHDELDSLEHHWISKLKPELNIKLAGQKSKTDRKRALRYTTMLAAKQQLLKEGGIGKNGPSPEQVLDRMLTILTKQMMEIEASAV